MYLEIENLTCRYGSHEALRSLTLGLDRADFLAVAGPNGSGKSTLVRAISGSLRPYAGAVRLDGRDIAVMTGRERARRMAVLAQETQLAFDFTVEEVVLMGRLPHLRLLQGEKASDRAAVKDAMTMTGTLLLADRSVMTLSGGERQRVLLARALAQEPDLLILDEPTAHLDVAFQVELLDLVASLNREQKLTVIAVLHDLNLAARYASRMLMLKEGAAFTEGPPPTVITEKNVAAVYGSRITVIPHPEDGTPHVILLSGGQSGISRARGHSLQEGMRKPAAIAERI